MSKKTATILIISIFVIIFGFLIYSYFRLGGGGDTTTGTGGFRDFFPFGKDRETGGAPSDGGVGGTDGAKMPTLRKISAEPVAGFTTYETGGKEKEKNIFRFILKATGNVFDIPEDALDSVRISNTTIPKIFEAKFLTEDGILVRYLDDDNQTIETYLSKIKKDANGNYTSLDGIYLAKNITETAVSPSGNIFYLEEKANGSVGSILNIKTNKSEVIFDSPLKEWSFLFPSDDQIFYFSKPSATIKGYMYALDPKSSKVVKILSGITGLSVNIGKDFKTLYSEYSGGRVYLSVGNAKNGVFGEFDIPTLAEKCVIEEVIYCAGPKFGASGNLPDSWYQGLTFFTDNIWRVSSDEESVVEMSDLSESSGEDIDAINLQLTKDGEYLLFINKRDGALWSLKVKEDTPKSDIELDIGTTTEETI